MDRLSVRPINLSNSWGRRWWPTGLITKGQTPPDALPSVPWLWTRLDNLQLKAPAHKIQSSIFASKFWGVFAKQCLSSAQRAIFGNVTSFQSNGNSSGNRQMSGMGAQPALYRRFAPQACLMGSVVLIPMSWSGCRWLMRLWVAFYSITLCCIPYMATIPI